MGEAHRGQVDDIPGHGREGPVQRLSSARRRGAEEAYQANTA